MLQYYCTLALSSLRRNVVLTVLMIVAIAVGIGASMTTLTVYRGMAGDPIPQKSSQLFEPQIDNFGPAAAAGGVFNYDRLPDQLSYSESVDLMNMDASWRRAAMYLTAFVVVPPDPHMQPEPVYARATYRDFFSMFDVPFHYGAPWSHGDDQQRAAVAVITKDLNDRLFNGANSVGRGLHLGSHDYRIVGVLDAWEPLPRFYDLNFNAYGKTEDVLIPFTRAIDQQLGMLSNTSCPRNIDPGWAARLNSDCVWVQFWVELPTAAAAASYRSLLQNYAAEQRRNGRFNWPPRTQLRDVRQWLNYHHVVSTEVRILLIVSFSFLFICLLNAMGLMLAKSIGRSRDIAVRRALGASRPAIYAQCLIETGVIGLIGGVLGLALTFFSLLSLRFLLSETGRDLLHLDVADVVIAMTLALLVTLVSGLYPTWRAAYLQPAPQLKAL